MTGVEDSLKIRTWSAAYCMCEDRVSYHLRPGLERSWEISRIKRKNKECSVQKSIVQSPRALEVCGRER